MSNKIHELSSYLSSLLKILLLFVFLLEVGCAGKEMPFPRCISADNFGLETVSIGAYYPEDKPGPFTANNGQSTATFSPDQVVRWVDTGMVTTGDPLIIKTSGMWTTWAKSNAKYTPAAGVIDLSDTEGSEINDDDTIPLNRICGPYSTKDCTVPGCSNGKCQYIDDGLKSDVKTGAYGAPCWFRNGHGAYILLRRNGDPDPNDTVSLMRSPRSPVAHLGYKSADEGGSGAFSSIENPIKDSTCKDVEPKQGWKVYVKILDRYYWDNAGGYAFEFVSGVKRESGVMIFETIRKEVKDVLINHGGKAIFERIVKNNSFKNLVYSLLTLFLMISALLYIFGMIQHPMPDFIARVLKISLVFMLISPGSWEFFYNHLLSLFINGTDTIIGIVNGHSGMKNYNQDAPFAFLDYMIRDRIFAPVVWNIKMRALIVGEFLGIFGIFFIIIAVLLYVFLCMYAFVIYLAGLIGMALLIALMPIFFIGILFSRLKSLFDGWLTQCISFSLQSIMIFTLVSLFGSLIMNTYYRLLGFTVCYNKWMEVKLCIGSFCLLDGSYYAWTPGQEYVPKVINVFGKSNVCDSLNCSYDSVSRFTFTGGGAVIPVPPEYTEKDFRYVDYPYFDPDATSSGNPDGISVKNQKFNNLVSLLNSLMALPPANSRAIARLVEDIKNEIKKLGSSSHLSKIEDSQNKNIPNNYKQLQEDVKNAIISIIGTDIVDPISKKELDEQYDYSIIKQIRRGYLIIWPELLVLLLLALLLSLMRSFVTNIGASLGGGSPMSTMLSGVWDAPVAQLVGLSQSLLSGGLTTIASSIAGKHKDISSTAIGGGLEKLGSSAMGAVKRVPILGTAISFTSEATKAITMYKSEFEVERKLDKQFKKLDYARAVVGSHLSYSGLDALKYFGKHTIDQMLGRKETGLKEDIGLQHKFFMEKLRDSILGPEKHKPSTYLPPKKSSDDESPFARSQPSVSREGDIGADAVDLSATHERDITFDKYGMYFDEDGNLQLKDDVDISEALCARADLLNNNNDNFNIVDQLLHSRLGDKYSEVINAYELEKQQKTEEDGERLRDESTPQLDISNQDITAPSDVTDSLGPQENLIIEPNQLRETQYKQEEVQIQTNKEIKQEESQIDDSTPQLDIEQNRTTPPDEIARELIPSNNDVQSQIPQMTESNQLDTIEEKTQGQSEERSRDDSTLQKENVEDFLEQSKELRDFDKLQTDREIKQEESQIDDSVLSEGSSENSRKGEDNHQFETDDDDKLSEGAKELKYVEDDASEGESIELDEDNPEQEENKEEDIFSNMGTWEAPKENEGSFAVDDQPSENTSLDSQQEMSSEQSTSGVDNDKPEPLQEISRSDESHTDSPKEKGSSGTKGKLEQIQEEQKKREEIKARNDAIEKAKEPQKPDSTEKKD